MWRGAIAMIETFRVQNYKALRDVELKLTPMHVLIGPNDSGKTSILEALGALCRSVEMPLEEAFLGRWRGQELVWNSEEKTHGPAIVGFEAKFADESGSHEYRLECEFQGVDRSVRVWGEFFEGEKMLGEFTPQTIVMSAGRLLFGPPNERLISNALFGSQYCRWNPRFLALPNAQDENHSFHFDPSGFGLALFLDDVLGVDRNIFAKIEDRFREVFPHVNGIILKRERAFRMRRGTSPDVQLLEEAEGKGIHLKLRSGQTVPVSQVSDGMLLLLAYLAVLYSPVKPRVLMVEEPENGVHPSRLKEVLQILRELVSEQSHTQVLMTTHSPYVLDAFSPEEVTLCKKGDDGAVKVHRLSDVKAVREQLDVFSLGEIWTAEGDEALARGDSNGAGGKQ
jgi:predicted ATPase